MNGQALREVDELFGSESAPKPRTAQIGALLLLGNLLAIIGLFCSSAPGGAVILWAWLLHEKELERLESGYLASTQVSHVRGMGTLVYMSVAILVLLFALQAVLFCGGFYDMLWAAAIDAMVQIALQGG